MKTLGEAQELAWNHAFQRVEELFPDSSDDSCDDDFIAFHKMQEKFAEVFLEGYVEVYFRMCFLYKFSLQITEEQALRMAEKAVEEINLYDRSLTDKTLEELAREYLKIMDESAVRREEDIGARSI